MANGKAPGPDGIPVEIYKYNGQRLVRRLVHLFSIIWEKPSVPQEFKDASIVHLYKRRGNSANCDNLCGITPCYSRQNVVQDHCCQVIE